MNIQYVYVQEGPLLLCLNDRMENIYINFDVPCFHVQYHVVCVHVQYHVCVTVSCLCHC